MLRLAVSSHIGSATTKRPMRAGEDRIEQSHSIRRSQEIESQRFLRCSHVRTNTDGRTARSVEAAPSSSAQSPRTQDIHDAKTQSSFPSVNSGAANDAQRTTEIVFRAFDVISCIGTVISTIIAALMWLELRKERETPESQALARRVDALEAKQESLGAVFRAERRVLMSL